jgi:hypothetical protein
MLFEKVPSGTKISVTQPTDEVQVPSGAKYCGILAFQHLHISSLTGLGSLVVSLATDILSLTGLSQQRIP